MHRRKFRPTCTGNHPRPFGVPLFGAIQHFTELGEYTEIATLGQGVHGRVFHAKLSTGYEVALKRFFKPEDVLDSIVHLLARRPAAFDLDTFPKTRVAFDSNGIVVYVQELCTQLDVGNQADCANATRFMATCPAILIKAGISHCDIKIDNLLVMTGRVVLGDLDSVVPITGAPRLTPYDNVGAHTQFVFGCRENAPVNIQHAAENLRIHNFDYHLGHAEVQKACMLLSCLMTSIDLQPCLSSFDSNAPAIWHVAIAEGCRLNMVVLEQLSKRHQSLFAEFCTAWTTAMVLIAKEPGAAAAMWPRPLLSLIE